MLLPSVSARREAFDEYCRERARELRESKVKIEKETSDPRQDFERLLKDEVKSTRTSWTEWRRQWKKDRRFYSWGRDDREREKRFRDYLKELGERESVNLSTSHSSSQLMYSRHRETSRSSEGRERLLCAAQGERPGSAWRNMEGGENRKRLLVRLSLTVI